MKMKFFALLVILMGSTGLVKADQRKYMCPPYEFSYDSKELAEEACPGKAIPAGQLTPEEIKLREETGMPLESRGDTDAFMF